MHTSLLRRPLVQTTMAFVWLFALANALFWQSKLQAILPRVEDSAATLDAKQTESEHIRGNQADQLRDLQICRRYEKELQALIVDAKSTHDQCSTKVIKCLSQLETGHTKLAHIQDLLNKQGTFLQEEERNLRLVSDELQEWESDASHQLRSFQSTDSPSDNTLVATSSPPLFTSSVLRRSPVHNTIFGAEFGAAAIHTERNEDIDSESPPADVWGLSEFLLPTLSEPSLPPSQPPSPTLSDSDISNKMSSTLSRSRVGQAGLPPYRRSFRQVKRGFYIASGQTTSDQVHQG